MVKNGALKKGIWPLEPGFKPWFHPQLCWLKKITQHLQACFYIYTQRYSQYPFKNSKELSTVPNSKYSVLVILIVVGFLLFILLFPRVSLTLLIENPCILTATLNKMNIQGLDSRGVGISPKSYTTILKSELGLDHHDFTVRLI